MSMWSADPTSTLPASYTTTAEEVVTLTCDVTALLVGGGAPSVSSTPARLFRIVDNGADEEVTGLSATTVNGNVLAQLLPTLTPGARYKLRWRFVTSGNTRACTTVIDCVE
jgi:hypothetical protein